jgi:hypothetical protein
VDADAAMRRDSQHLRTEDLPEGSNHKEVSPSLAERRKGRCVAPQADGLQHRQAKRQSGFLHCRQSKVRAPTPCLAVRLCHDAHHLMMLYQSPEHRHSKLRCAQKNNPGHTPLAPPMCG